MNSFQNAIKKIGKKNFIAALLLCLVCGIGYAIKKESITEAIIPTLLGIVLVIGGAINLAMITAKYESKKSK